MRNVIRSGEPPLQIGGGVVLVPQSGHASTPSELVQMWGLTTLISGDDPRGHLYLWPPRPDMFHPLVNPDLMVAPPQINENASTSCVRPARMLNAPLDIWLPGATQPAPSVVLGVPTECSSGFATELISPGVSLALTGMSIRGSGWVGGGSFVCPNDSHGRAVVSYGCVIGHEYDPIQYEFDLDDPSYVALLPGQDVNQLSLFRIHGQLDALCGASQIYFDVLTGSLDGKTRVFVGKHGLSMAGIAQSLHWEHAVLHTRIAHYYDAWRRYQAIVNLYGGDALAGVCTTPDSYTWLDFMEQLLRPWEEAIRGKMAALRGSTPSHPVYLTIKGVSLRVIGAQIGLMGSDVDKGYSAMFVLDTQANAETIAAIACSGTRIRSDAERQQLLLSPYTFPGGFYANSGYATPGDIDDRATLLVTGGYVRRAPNGTRIRASISGYTKHDSTLLVTPFDMIKTDTIQSVIDQVNKKGGHPLSDDASMSDDDVVIMMTGGDIDSYIPGPNPQESGLVASDAIVSTSIVDPHTHALTQLGRELSEAAAKADSSNTIYIDPTRFTQELKLTTKRRMPWYVLLTIVASSASIVIKLMKGLSEAGEHAVSDGGEE